MRKIIISVSYSLDKAAWQDSMIKKDIITVGESLHDTIKTYLTEKDYVEFAKTTAPQEMYRDSADGEAIQTGWVYRMSTEIQHDDGKWHKYR